MSKTVEISRELAERLCPIAFVPNDPDVWRAREELRSLLAAPVVERQDVIGTLRRVGQVIVFDVIGDPHIKDGMEVFTSPPAPVAVVSGGLDAAAPIPDYFIDACDKFDWTAEEALRFYADGKHFDTENGRTRILCTGAIASYALKNLGTDYAAMKGAVEPEAWKITYADDGELHRIGLSAEQAERLGADPYYKVTPLYAAACAALPKRLLPPNASKISDYEEGVIYGWNACIDKVKELNQ